MPVALVGEDEAMPVVEYVIVVPSPPVVLKLMKPDEHRYVGEISRKGTCANKGIVNSKQPQDQPITLTIWFRFMFVVFSYKAAQVDELLNAERPHQ